MPQMIYNGGIQHYFDLDSHKLNNYHYISPEQNCKFYQICEFDMSLHSHTFSDVQITCRSIASCDCRYNCNLTLKIYHTHTHTYKASVIV